tara:strand:- start:910 stop:1170 length:261 start_codon:yes stop_codon:yes gene_type:complete
MNFNILSNLIKSKVLANKNIESVKVEDKSFLHKNHASNQKDKFHIKLTIISKEFKAMNKIQSNKIIFKLLEDEIKKKIHSIQIFFV